MFFGLFDLVYHLSFLVLPLLPFAEQGVGIWLSLNAGGPVRWWQYSRICQYFLLKVAWILLRQNGEKIEAFLEETVCFISLSFGGAQILTAQHLYFCVMLNYYEVKCRLTFSQVNYVCELLKRRMFSCETHENESLDNHLNGSISLNQL